MKISSQEYSQNIERIKKCLNSAEGVSIEDYKKWVAMLDMLLQVKISMENFEINTALDEQVETFKKEEVTKSIKKFNLDNAVKEVVDHTKDAMLQRDLQIQNDCGLTEEQELKGDLNNE